MPKAKPKKVEKKVEKKHEKPNIKVKRPVTENVVVAPKVEVRVVEKKLPTWENVKVVNILIENDPVQKGHHLCKMSNGTTMHVPIRLFN